MAVALWGFALFSWIILLYFSFAVLSFLNTAWDASVVHGGWLIAIVGTQSLVLLGVRVADYLVEYGTGLIVLAHMLWGIGLALYAMFVTLFSYRIFFFKLTPEDLSPLLWVVMGAAAISANAGTSLLLNNAHVPYLTNMKPFIDGVTLIIWAWGTWWIPLLVCLCLEARGLSYAALLQPRFVESRVPTGHVFRRDIPAFAGGAIPNLGREFVWVAVLVWLATAFGMLVSKLRASARRIRQPCQEGHRLLHL
jgi:hypothetical protein